jgi:hypothetical protein
MPRRPRVPSALDARSAARAHVAGESAPACFLLRAPTKTSDRNGRRVRCYLALAFRLRLLFGMSEHPRGDCVGGGARERPAFSSPISRLTVGGLGTGPGTQRSPVPAAVAPGHRRAEGRDSRSPGSLTPGPPGRGHGTGGRHLRFHRHGQIGPSPWHRAPTALDRPRRGRDLAGMARPGWASQAPLISDYAVTGAGLSGARFPWLRRDPDLTGCPGIPELPAWPGGSARWAAGVPCGQPLVPTGPRLPVQIFSNYSVLAGEVFTFGPELGIRGLGGGPPTG